MATTTKVFLGNVKGPAGPQGPQYTLTDEDRDTIADAVRASLTPDTWVFTMDDDSVVTKKVVIG